MNTVEFTAAKLLKPVLLLFCSQYQVSLELYPFSPQWHLQGQWFPSSDAGREVKSDEHGEGTGRE